jgi:hypothetical protein
MVDRHDCGKIVQRTPRVDHGPPEVVQKRMLDAGKGDPALTSYPLGLLLANGVIEQPEHDGGCLFALHHSIAFGKPTITAARMENVSRGTSDWEDEGRVVRSKTLYRGAEIALKHHSEAYFVAVRSAAIYEQRPSWTEVRVPDYRQIREAFALLDGLKVLAVEFGKRRGPPKLEYQAPLLVVNADLMFEGSPMERRA